MSSLGRIFEIQHLAAYDGPGIRTVVYLKGCPLRCIWCHNPEGMCERAQMFYHGEKCVGCQKCADVCPHKCHVFANGSHGYDRGACQGCETCARYCQARALEPVGYTADASEIIDEIQKDRPFYANGGGLTISGGEPLMQPAFTKELLRLAKERGLDTCIETSGYCGADALLGVIPLTDLFLFDIKETDNDRHKEFTGVYPAVILGNLRLLNDRGARVMLRCPVIPDCNMREEHFVNVAVLAQELSCVEAVELEPYHPLGLAKYEALSMTPAYTDGGFLDAVHLREYAAKMRKYTDKPVRMSTGELIP